MLINIAKLTWRRNTGGKRNSVNIAAYSCGNDPVLEGNFGIRFWYYILYKIIRFEYDHSIIAFHQNDKIV